MINILSSTFPNGSNVHKCFETYVKICETYVCAGKEEGENNLKGLHLLNFSGSDSSKSSTSENENMNKDPICHIL